MSGDTALPCPPLTWRVTLAPACNLAEALRVLPARPGVFAIVDHDRRPVCLCTTANLRRQCRSKLESLSGSTFADSAKGAGIAGELQVLACTVGSRFESDWAYLQLARRFMPESYSSLLDRWRGWFVHCNPDATFPQFIKTSTPGTPPTGRQGVYLGPMADKHSAQRLIETLVTTFDLCRYQHILVQSPHGSACAYKEMGRCSAPCDGTVTIDHYHEQIRAALGCVKAPQRWRIEQNAAMVRDSAARAFEAAARSKRMLDDAAALSRGEFRLVRSLDEFRFLAVMPSESPGHGRLFAIDRGWIAPVLDVPLDASPEALMSLEAHPLEFAHARWRFDFQNEAIENIGMVCWHMLRPTPARETLDRSGDPPGRRSAHPPGEFLPWDCGVDWTSVSRALHRLKRGRSNSMNNVSDQSLDISR
jgi:hypothetical protein